LKFYKTPFAIVAPLFAVGALTGGGATFYFGVLLIILLSFLFGCFLLRKTNSHWFLAGVGIAFILLGAEVMLEYRTYGDSQVGENSSAIVQIEEAEVTDKPWKKAIARITYRKKEGNLIPCSERVLIFVQSQLIEGDELFLVSDFSRIENKRNPGEFDAKSYWNNKNIYKIAFVGESDFKFVSHDPPSWIRRFFRNIRSDLSNALDENLSEEQAGVGKALLLGDKSDLSIETKESFSNAGAMHVLAVSGLHVGIIMYLLLFLLGRFSRFISRRTAVVICILFVWCYAGVTGFSPSVMRAAFMFSVLMFAQVWSQGSNSINTLFFSAFILLLINPLLIYSIGFQLSYLAVFGILILYDRIARLVMVENKWLRKLWEGTAVGIAAQIFTIPLTLYYFHQFPNYFMISNLGVMLMAGVLLTIGVLFFSFKAIPFLKVGLSLILGIGISVLLFIVQFVEELPGSVATGFEPSAMLVVLMYVLIAGLLIFQTSRRAKYIGVATVFLVLIGMQWSRFQHMTQDEIVFFNSNVPVLAVKVNDRIECFHLGKEKNHKRVHMLVDGYSKVRPGKVNYHFLKEGKTTLKTSSGTVEMTTINRNVYLKVKGKTYFFRSKAKIEERLVDQTIDLPYLSGLKSNYNLKNGAYRIEL
jgi:competence protein ComEC